MVLAVHLLLAGHRRQRAELGGGCSGARARLAAALPVSFGLCLLCDAAQVHLAVLHTCSLCTVRGGVTLLCLSSTVIQGPMAQPGHISLPTQPQPPDPADRTPCWCLVLCVAACPVQLLCLSLPLLLNCLAASPASPMSVSDMCLAVCQPTGCPSSCEIIMLCLCCCLLCTCCRSTALCHHVRHDGCPPTHAGLPHPATSSGSLFDCEPLLRLLLGLLPATVLLGVKVRCHLIKCYSACTRRHRGCSAAWDLSPCCATLPCHALSLMLPCACGAFG